MDKLLTIAIKGEIFDSLKELKRRWSKHNMTEVIQELMRRVKDYD